MIGRIRHLTPSMVDPALAVVLAVLAEFELFFVGLTPHEAVANAITLPFMTLPLALRRRAPTVGLLVIVAAGRLQPLVGGTFRNGGTVPILVLLLAMYSVAAGKDVRGALVGGGLAVAVLVTTPPVTPSDLIYRLALVTVPWVLGRVVRDRQERAEGLEVRAKRIQMEQDAKIEVATEEERARIARELHDIVAHSVGVMVIQASGAQKVLDKRPQQAREALQSIEVTGRQALDELQRVLGILRTDSDGESLTPQPSLRHLDTLLEQIRQGGLPVEATIEGDVRQLPPGIELAAYRIVQEALTNSLKHAGKAKAELTIRYRAHDLQVEICDDGRGPSPTAANGSGHGLVGMRERVSLYGGTLAAGPLPGGGYSVRAALPLDG
jgi:signal transduction histidine kinase